MATAIIIDDFGQKVKQIKTTDYPIVTIEEISGEVRIEEILPFRVRFTAIQIEKIGLGNTPPIPLQVIGYSNYIL